MAEDLRHVVFNARAQTRVIAKSQCAKRVPKCWPRGVVQLLFMMFHLRFLILTSEKGAHYMHARASVNTKKGQIRMALT